MFSLLKKTLSGEQTHLFVHLPPILPAQHLLRLLAPLGLGDLARQHLEQSVRETLNNLIQLRQLQQLFVLLRHLAKFLQLENSSNISF